MALNRKAAAWLVHLYTASGGVLGMFALFAVVQGEIRLAFLILIVTMIIDGTDGVLARRVGVSDMLPGFSGAQVDNVVDVLNYMWVPVFIMGTEGLLPHIAWTALPVLATLYAYGQVNMKTADAFFLGFPSYWSTIALYMFWLKPEPLWAVLMVLIPTIMTFIPMRYLYPSKNHILWRTSWTLGAIWFALVMYLLMQEIPDPALVLISLFYPVYYFVVSVYVDLQIRRGRFKPPVDTEY